jgi:hypothetical protein
MLQRVLAMASPTALEVSGTPEPDVPKTRDELADRSPAAQTTLQAKPIMTPIAWLDSVSFFIPKVFREPYIGDLREDLAEMATKGYSGAAINLRATSQIIMVALRHVGGLIVEALKKRWSL